MGGCPENPEYNCAFYGMGEFPKGSASCGEDSCILDALLERLSDPKRFSESTYGCGGSCHPP